jgi:DnaJ-class molecular chaperone
MTTAKIAYSKYIEIKTKFQERGYGSMVITINECPDCEGTGKTDNKVCSTCGNEPDRPDRFIKVGSNWHRRP